MRSSKCGATSPIDLPGGPSEVVVLALARSTRGWSSWSSPPRGSTARTPSAAWSRRLAEAEEIAPEHLVLLGEEAEALAGQVRNAGSVFVGSGRRYPQVTTRPAAITFCRRAAGHGLWAGLARTFLKPVTMQRLTEQGLALVRPTVEALAAAEGMPAHAEAVRR